MRHSGFHAATVAIVLFTIVLNEIHSATTQSAHALATVNYPHRYHHVLTTSSSVLTGNDVAAAASNQLDEAGAANSNEKLTIGNTVAETEKLNAYNDDSTAGSKSGLENANRPTRIIKCSNTILNQERCTEQNGGNKGLRLRRDTWRESGKSDADEEVEDVDQEYYSDQSWPLAMAQEEVDKRGRPAVDGFLGMRGKKKGPSDAFYGMLGRRAFEAGDDDDDITDDDEVTSAGFANPKRDIKDGFLGMRGKKVMELKRKISNAFLGMRGKKNEQVQDAAVLKRIRPSSNDFIGMRGKKKNSAQANDAGAIEASEAHNMQDSNGGRFKKDVNGEVMGDGYQHHGGRARDVSSYLQQWANQLRRRRMSYDDRNRKVDSIFIGMRG